jgi:hypothetical protein
VGEGLDRDRGVDESGHQMTAFGRIGGRPLNLEEQRRFYVRDGRLYRVDNDGRVWEEGSRGELTPVKDLYPHEGTAPPDAMMKR